MKQFVRVHYFLLCLVVGSMLAAFMSFMIGIQQSVWFDEVYSIMLAERSWGEIASLTANDVHPPLYYWLLKAWVLLFGSSEAALRSLSVVLLGLSVGIAGLLLRKLFSARVAVVALPFIVFAPFLLRYGFEIRMYALASFIGVLATYLLVLAVAAKERRKRLLLLAGYSLLVVLGMYTLYMMALVWIAHLIWVVCTTRSDRNLTLFLQVAAAYSGAFLLYVPWLVIMFGSTSMGALSPVASSIDLESLEGMGTYLLLYRPPWTVSWLLVCLLLGAILYVAAIGFKQAKAKERRSLWLLMSYFLSPILILIVLTQFMPIYLERYLAHYALGGYMGVGVLAAFALRKPTKQVIVATAILAAVFLSGTVSFASYGNYNFQRLHTPTPHQAAALVAGCESDTAIVAADPLIAMEIDFYVDNCPVYFYSEWAELGGGYAMLSGSPLRVAEADDLPAVSTIFHVFYGDPESGLLTGFQRVDRVEVEAIKVETYQAIDQ